MYPNSSIIFAEITALQSVSSLILQSNPVCPYASDDPIHPARYEFYPLPVYFVYVALVASIIHYSLAVALFPWRAKIPEGSQKAAPSVPYVVPFIGSFPIGFAWNPLRFILSSKYLFWNKHPVKMQLLLGDLYILQGAKNIIALFKQHDLSAFVLHGTLLRQVFRLPKPAAAIYHQDNSGAYAEPNPESAVDAHNRVEYHTRTSFLRFLNGPGLAPLSHRFERNVTARFQSLAVGAEWTYQDHLADIFYYKLAPAVVESMCGYALLQRHPEFTKDFWEIDHNSMSFFTGIARIFNLKACRARDRALSAIKEWHSWARENFDPNTIGDDGDDPYWGSKFFRDRQGIFFGMDGFDADALASEELGLIWASNTNAIISAFWCALEVFKDIQLLNDVRHEVESCIIERTSSNITFDTDRLKRQPLLQAVFAETLRLRVHGFIVRYPRSHDLTINDYVIPKSHFVVASSTPGHMDPDMWCTGDAAAYPPSQFWPGRFLRYDSPSSTPKFSLAGTDGSWMPFGGGAHMCPGRRFAKLEIILSMALLVTLYDINILASPRSMEMSTKNFGFGVLGPKGKIPFRIRRRAMG